jgi:hypothetical protein
MPTKAKAMAMDRRESVPVRLRVPGAVVDVVADASVTVIVASARAVPPTSPTLMVWVPTTVPAGIVTVVWKAPDESAVTVPMVVGVLASWIWSEAPPGKPVPLIGTACPAATVPLNSIAGPMVVVVTPVVVLVVAGTVEVEVEVDAVVEVVLPVVVVGAGTVVDVAPVVLDVEIVVVVVDAGTLEVVVLLAVVVVVVVAPVVVVVVPPVVVVVREVVVVVTDPIVVEVVLVVVVAPAGATRKGDENTFGAVKSFWFRPTYRSHMVVASHSGLLPGDS